MTLVPAPRSGERRLAWLPTWPSLRTWQRSALVVRLVQVVAGIAVFLVPAQRFVLLDVLTVLGLLVAVMSPARNGQALVLIGGLGTWFLSGANHHPSVARTLVFAFFIYVIHNATALASTVPIDCQLQPDVVRRWLGRCGVTLAVSAVLIGVVYLIEAATAGTTTPILELAGVVGVLVIVLIGALLFSRLLKAER